MNGYRLVRRAPGAQRPQAPGRLEHGPDGARDRAAPRLDDAQQRVVDHKGGPLLVLAGPGTGKTTTIVEAVAERIERRGTDPERILVLTFSRKAAAELRDRITARLGRTTSEPLALTFHSYAYALVSREFVLAGDQPPRLLSAPEQLLEIRRLLRGEAADGALNWPERLRPALATSGFAEELRDVLMRAAERGPRRQVAAPAWQAVQAGRLGGGRARSSTGTRRASTSRRCPPTTTRRSSGSPRGCWAGRRPGSGSATPTTRCSSTSTRTATRRRSRCCWPWRAMAGT